ncbi:hypothetical protein COO60DRAFT_877172 [Scenedesmus sp. NREL 46B-D3]|nr:hypothetical protein COO60DRAFT_877172 [Scenedesmus sp. NREL 46B-D3]
MRHFSRSIGSCSKIIAVCGMPMRHCRVMTHHCSSTAPSFSSALRSWSREVRSCMAKWHSRRLLQLTCRSSSRPRSSVSANCSSSLEAALSNCSSTASCNQVWRAADKALVSRGTKWRQAAQLHGTRASWRDQSRQLHARARRGCPGHMSLCQTTAEPLSRLSCCGRRNLQPAAALLGCERAEEMRRLRERHAKLQHAVVQQQLAHKDHSKQQVAAAKQHAHVQQQAARTAAQQAQLVTKQQDQPAAALAGSQERPAHMAQQLQQAYIRAMNKPVAHWSRLRGTLASKPGIPAAAATATAAAQAGLGRNCSAAVARAAI